MFDSMFVSVLCDIATDDYLQQRPYHTNGRRAVYDRAIYECQIINDYQIVCSYIPASL